MEVKNTKENNMGSSMRTSLEGFEPPSLGYSYSLSAQCFIHRISEAKDTIQVMLQAHYLGKTLGI